MDDQLKILSVVSRLENDPDFAAEHEILMRRLAVAAEQMPVEDF